MKLLLSIYAAAAISAAGTPVQNVQSYLENAISGKELSDASAGALAVTASGDTIFCADSKKMLVPASNMKLVTTALGLHSLGGDYRYETSIGYSGTLTHGILKGDLYIIGGGDPTTGSKDTIAPAIESVFRQWRQILKDAGIKKIEGHIIGDGRCFPGMPEQESWQYNDIGTYYGTGTSGLSFYENTQSFKVSAGDCAGAPVKITPSYPETPWMNFRYSCTTGKKGSGNTLYLYTSDLAPEGEFRGSFAIDRKPKTEDASNKFPAYTCAYHFTEYLRGCGVECTEGPADLGHIFGIPENRICPQSDLSIIGSTLSPQLARIAFETNHQSNNFFAETIFRTLGKEYCGSGCYDSSYVAVENLLEELNVGNEGLRIRDGSGLSRTNYISTEFLCRLLRTMMESPAFEDFFESLPYPGGNGTLQWLMQSVPERTRERIRMKSGSMGGVRSFSGYIIPRSGSKEDTIIFSIIVNNFTCTSAEVNTRLNRIISLLAECN